MVTKKVKKVNKYRGGVTHGRGSRKKRRGAGSRGGRGKAGSGKRAGHKITKKLGTKGFRPKRSFTEVKAVNLDYFSVGRLEGLLKAEKITKENDIYQIDLRKVGFDKLLGLGNIKLKLKIIAPAWSKSAEEKIKAAGGEISNE